MSQLTCSEPALGRGHYTSVSISFMEAMEQTVRLLSLSLSVCLSVCLTLSLSLSLSLSLLLLSTILFAGDEDSANTWCL